MRAHLMIRSSAFIGVIALLSLAGCVSPRESSSGPDVLNLGSDVQLSPSALRDSLRAGKSPVSPRLLDAYLSATSTQDFDSSLVWQSFRAMLAAGEAYSDDTSRAHLE